MSGATASSPPLALSGPLLADDDGRSGVSSEGGHSIQEMGKLIFAEKWDAVKAAVRSDPRSASLRNWAKKTPLHMCCEQGAPLDAVRTVLRAHPAAASRQDIFGYTPLHVAFVSEDADNTRWVARELVKACPEALAVGDKQGYAPLHRAVSAKMPLPVLVDLIAARPESISATSDRGGVPLDSAPLETVERILSSPDTPPAAALEIGSVLHWACRPRPSATVDVGALIGSHPEAVRTADGRGRLPLHVGCLWRKYFPDTYLTALLRAYPEASAIPDRDGNTPLHYACEAGYTDRGEIKSEAEAEAFRELISTSGRGALTRRNGEGRTPLHAACRSRALRPEAFQVLLDACPEAIRCEDDHGSTPVVSFMEGCCEHNARHFTAHGLLMDEKVWHMLNVLLRAYFADDASDAPLPDGSHTLHSCLRVRRCPRDFLWLVASQYPEQIASKDTRGRLPLHAASASLDPSDIDATSFLLDLVSHHPAAASVRDDDGKFPLTHMIEAGRTWGSGVREAVLCHPRALYDCFRPSSSSSSSFASAGSGEVGWGLPEAAVPHVASRAASAGKLEAVFELVRGRPHKFFGGLACAAATDEDGDGMAEDEK